MADISIWGVPVLLIGRIGKIVQYTGGLVAILDIIGPERLQDWARGVTHSTKEFTNRLRPPYKITVLAISFANTVALALAAGAAFSIKFPNVDPLATRLSPEFIAGAALIEVAVIAYAIAISIDKVASPMVRLLRNQHSGHPVRWGAFIFLTIGFLLDLFAS